MEEQLIKKILPHSAEAEQSVIGAMIMDQEAILTASEILTSDDFYNPHHKAILRMIRMVVDNAHKAGKWAGICGELGADLSLTETFVRMGVDELSVAPSMVLKLRKTIREMRYAE